jgi:hypothetical protein
MKTSCQWFTTTCPLPALQAAKGKIQQGIDVYSLILKKATKLWKE